MLHVTNGTSVSLAESGIGGEILAWVDVLHEGPVPSGIDDDELRRVRGIFLDGAWQSSGAARAELARRDRTLARHEEIVLWFEHDLYDQLQLIQVLDRLGGSKTRLNLICTDQYLGPMTGGELALLWPKRRPVGQEQFDLASAAWRAFRSPDPMNLQALLEHDTSALPFLAGALRRHLQQFPAIENGLSRTEQQILEVLSEGPRTFAELFPAEQQREERIFMGDSSLFRYVRGLTEARAPLAQERDGVYRLTETGREVLAGRADHVRLNGINRWLGGVHLVGHETLWRWDQSANVLRRR